MNNFSRHLRNNINNTNKVYHYYHTKIKINEINHDSYLKYDNKVTFYCRKSYATLKVNERFGSAYNVKELVPSEYTAIGLYNLLKSVGFFGLIKFEDSVFIKESDKHISDYIYDMDVSSTSGYLFLDKFGLYMCGRGESRTHKTLSHYVFPDTLKYLHTELIKHPKSSIFDIILCSNL